MLRQQQIEGIEGIGGEGEETGAEGPSTSAAKEEFMEAADILPRPRPRGGRKEAPASPGAETGTCRWFEKKAPSLGTAPPPSLEGGG